MIAAQQIYLGRGNDRLNTVDCLSSDGLAYCIIPHVHQDAGYVRVEVVYRVVSQIVTGTNLFGGADSTDQNGMTGYKPAVIVGQNAFEMYGPTSSYSPLRLDENEDSSLNYLDFTFDSNGETKRKMVLNGNVAQSNTYSYMSSVKIALFTQTKGDSILTNRITAAYGIRTFRYFDGKDNLISDLVACSDNGHDGYFFDRKSRSVLASEFPGHPLIAHV